MKPIVIKKTVVTKTLDLPYTAATSESYGTVHVARELAWQGAVRVGVYSALKQNMDTGNSQVFMAKDLRELAALFLEIASVLDEETARDNPR